MAVYPIRIKRGLKKNIPILAVGEPIITTDTKEVFIGDGANNQKIMTVIQAIDEADAIAKTAGTTNLLAWWV